MKKIFCLLLVITTVFVPIITVMANATVISEQDKEYFDDGSYIVTEIKDSAANEDMNIFAKLMNFIRKLISFFSNSHTVSKTKYANYYDSKGTLLWTASLQADFTYNGKISSCKTAGSGIDIFDGDWKEISSSVVKEDNIASADFSVQQYKLGVKLKNIQKHLTLECDKDGNVK